MLLMLNFCSRNLRQLLLPVFLFASLHGAAQHLTLSVQKASLVTVFSQIEQQSDYRFLYTEEMLSASQPVSFTVKKVSLDSVLQLCFRQQPLGYTIEGKHIIVRKKIIEKPIFIAREIRGKVVNEQGEPVEGVTLQVKRSGFSVVSTARGEFAISLIPESDILVASGAELETQEIAIAGRSVLTISMKARIPELDQVIMMAYGQTTKRLNTGNIGKVSSAAISKQPVSNPIAALQGRIPGVVITQSSGVPGSAFKVEIRGRTALDFSLSKNDPLYVIDGIPFEMGNTATNLIASAANNPTSTSEGGLSALNTINPQDIESIEILKDADATAIYGSRGANGVVLITTKFGKSGKTKVYAGFTNGSSRTTRRMKMLTTQQYVQMRKEAFTNDGITPTIANAPDILLWDTTRYTDMQQLLTGGTTRYFDGQVSLSGGNAFTTFLVGGGIHRETTVFPGDFSDVRVSANMSLNHISANKKFSLVLKTLYANDNNQLLSTDVSQYFRLPPNLQLYDSAGNLSWEEKGIPFSSFNNFINPLALLNECYQSVNDNLSTTLNLKYQLFGKLSLRTSFGYNVFRSDETSIKPKTSIAPNSATLPSARFGNSTSKSWIIEPQLEYQQQIKKAKISFLLGTSFQDRSYRGTAITGSNYSSDLLLNSLSAAGAITASNLSTQYRYTAFFTRANFNWADKYILNISARRDGSSRFGPQEQFSNFGSVGGAWIFSSEKLFQHTIKWISFGKLRGSFGQTGNDQIGDYKYYDLWSNIPPTYQGVTGLIPVGLFNPHYSWEVNRKLEASIDLGLWKDRILLSAAYYRHRSSNQLTNYNLPIQAGFATVVKNLPALVQNSGLELSISSKNIRTSSFSWQTSFNLTVPKNKLISFPGLASSNYFTTYVEGKSLSVIRRYKFLGVDPQTGVYSFEDVDKDGLLTVSKDYQLLGNRDPIFYGGIQNSLSFKTIELDFLFQFVKQTGSNYLSSISSFVPGRAFNQPAIVTDRWQTPGTVTPIQRYTTSNSTTAGIASATRLNVSDGIYSDASFVRLKTVSLSFHPSAKLLKKIPVENVKCFINAQNLLTITRFKGTDPENQSYFQVPPLRTIAFGTQLTL